MLINDLIHKLQEIQSQYGNIDVTLYNNMDYQYYNRIRLYPVITRCHWTCKKDKHIRVKASEKIYNTLTNGREFVLALQIDK